MLIPLTSAAATCQLAAGQLPPASLAVRTVIRAVLFGFIALLLGYIVVEQIGFWWRRRSGRDK
jgi:hypothetical protein